MAAGAQAQTEAGQAYARRARGVWVVMALSTVLFGVVCAASSAGIYSYLTSVMRPQWATLRPITRDPSAESQLTVKRNLERASNAVSGETTIGQGDEVHTGAATEAEIVLFDDSTAHLFFGSTVLLERLQSSRFIGNAESVALAVDAGTVVLSTAPLEPSTKAEYSLRTPHCEVQVPPNSTVRVEVLAEQGVARSTRVVVSFGSAQVVSAGEKVALQPGQMTSVAADGPPEEPRVAEQNLIRNGTFTDPPTSGAEFGERGGLNTAAWLPIRAQAGEPTADGGGVQVVEETVGTTLIRAARISREGEDGQVAKVGLRQEINAPAEFLNQIDLRLRVKIVKQADPPGGPRGDLFPLIVAVLYTDPNGEAREWRHSFYLPQGGAPEIANVTQVGQPGAWETVQDWIKADRAGASPTPIEEFTLKKVDASPAIGQEVSVVRAIEIYGFGTGFQSWVTDVSLLAR